MPMIYVTKPYMPPLEDFIPYLEKIWQNRILTNGGPFHQQLEQALCTYLEAEAISLFSNGTLALITALQALRIKGEVITTPFSFVATSHALLWQGIKPVFVDIDPISLNIDPYKIEAAITPETTAILAVHCYGTPCNVEKIQELADNYNLKVIYDACHAFGVKDKSGSILQHGDLSVLSFHATKIFNTFEGGAIICHDKKTKNHIDHLKNFGFIDETTIAATGINGKMNEVSAAFGLLQLEHVDLIIEKRKKVDHLYRLLLENIEGIDVLHYNQGVTRNFSYFPILIKNNYHSSRDTLYQKLKKIGINTRRYFYPLISEFPMYRGLPSADANNLLNATKISREVLCLPIYPDLEEETIIKICESIKGKI